MAFLKTLLFILLGYYLIKILLRLFGPKIIRYAGKKAEAHFREQFGDMGQGTSKNTTGEPEITMDKRGRRKKANTEKVGEYVDFEEID